MHIFGLAFILYFLKLSAGKGFDYAVTLSVNLDLYIPSLGMHGASKTRNILIICAP